MKGISIIYQMPIFQRDNTNFKKTSVYPKKTWPSLVLAEQSMKVFFLSLSKLQFTRAQRARLVHHVREARLKMVGNDRFAGILARKKKKTVTHV